MENYQNQKTSKLGLVGKVIFSVLGIVGLASIVGCAPGPGDPDYYRYQQLSDAEQVRMENERTLRFMSGGLLGMAASGAGDIGDPRRDLALRGAASGLQNYSRDEAIRNSGQVNNTRPATTSPQTEGPTILVVGKVIPKGTTIRDTDGNSYILTKPLMRVVPVYLEHIPKGQLPNFFTYKKWNDFNKNGRIEINELWDCGEPIKQGDNFYLHYDFSYRANEKGEVLVLIDPKIGAIKWNMKIFSPAGQCVLDDSGEVPTIAAYLTKGILSNDVQTLIKDVGCGTYKAVIDADGKTEVIDFELQCE